MSEQPQYIRQARLSCGCQAEHDTALLNVICESHRRAFFDPIYALPAMRETVAYGPAWMGHAWNAVEYGGQWSVKAGDQVIVPGLPKEVACRVANRHNDSIKRVYERAQRAANEARQ